MCGLRWSFDQQQLASGGNDNRLNIWSLHSNTPTFSLLKHTAAVKALASFVLSPKCAKDAGEELGFSVIDGELLKKSLSQVAKIG